MASRLQNSWISGLNQYLSSFNWIKNYKSYTSVEQFFKQPYIPSWTSSKTFLWTHQQWVAGGAVVLALLLLRWFWRSQPTSSPAKDKSLLNQPQSPIVTLRSTFQCARVDIQIPPGLPAPPPHVTLTFCIDTSGSMKDYGRMDAVKRGVSNVLTRAQEVLDQRGGKISMTIVGFDT